MWWRIIEGIYSYDSEYFYKTKLANELGTSKENLNRYWSDLIDLNIIKIKEKAGPNLGRSHFICHTWTGEQLFGILRKLEDKERDFLFDSFIVPLIKKERRRKATGFKLRE